MRTVSINLCAPFSLRALAALQIVPPESTKSSTIIHFFPSTEPMTFIALDTPGASLRLSIIAKSASSFFANALALKTPPTSGEQIQDFHLFYLI